MRATSSAQWAICALAIMIAVPAVAFVDSGAASAGSTKSKSLSDCTAFDQNDKSEDTVELTIHNTCTVPVDCAISWRVVCAPDSKKRRASHAGSKKLALSTAGSSSAEVSAAVCGDDSWTIDSINWSCEPNKE